MITIGDHRLLCGDLTQGAVETLLGDETVDVIYTDPPWGPPMLESFAKIAGTSHGMWPDFLKSLATVCAKVRKPHAPVFVEMGLRWETELAKAMEVGGLPLLGRWEGTYGSKKTPFVLQLFGSATQQPIRFDKGLGGEAITRSVLKAALRTGDLLLDPCTGLGMTARMAVKYDAHFRGVELSKERLARTEAYLRGH